jgi:dTDP-glucose pyrophosphorylase
MNNKCNILIPMSGLGTRFQTKGYTDPKPLIRVLDDSMVRTVIKNLNFPGAYFIFIINETQISTHDFNLHVSDLLDSFTVVSVKEVTCGPACSSLLAEDSILNDIPLIIANCDQVVHDFDFGQLLEFCETRDADGALGCFLSTSEKNSYVLTDYLGSIRLVKEKQVISNLATNGIHFWMKGKHFVESAKAMVEAGDTHNQEYYVAPSYNYLIKDGKKILPFFYNLHFPIGTPEDLEFYQETYSYAETQN